MDDETLQSTLAAVYLQGEDARRLNNEMNARITTDDCPYQDEPFRETWFKGFEVKGERIAQKACVPAPTPKRKKGRA